MNMLTFFTKSSRQCQHHNTFLLLLYGQDAYLDLEVLSEPTTLFVEQPNAIHIYSQGRTMVASTRG